MGPPGHVPGRHDAVGGEQGLARYHPVVEGEARALQPTDRGGTTPIPTTTTSAPRSDPSARWTTTGVPPPGSEDTRSTPTPVRTVTPSARCRRGTGVTHLLAQDPAQGGGQRLHHGDLGAQAPAGGGHLGADEAGSDDHQPGPVPGGGQVAADGQAVVERAQRADPGEAFGAGQGAGGGAGGHDQAVVGELGPVVARHRPGLEVEGGGRPAQPEFETQGVEDVGRMMVDAGHVPGAGQQLLGQRGTVVGGVDLVPQDDHRARMPFVPDLLGSPEARPTRLRPRRRWHQGRGRRSWPVIVGSRRRAGSRAPPRRTGPAGDAVAGKGGGPERRVSRRTWSSTARGCADGRRSCGPGCPPSWPRARASRGGRDTARCHRAHGPAGW